MQAFQTALAEHERQDRVLRVVRDAETIEALHVAREEVAAEAAALLFDKSNTLPASREFGRICSRRVAALREIGKLTVEIAHAAPGLPSVATIRRVVDLLRIEVESIASEILSEDDLRRHREALERRLADGGLDKMIAGNP